MTSLSLHSPRVDVMVSVAQAYRKASLGAILTGMRQDGVIGLRKLNAAGEYVVGQDEATCVVYGMPRAAANAGLVDRVAPLGRHSPGPLRVDERLGAPDLTEKPLNLLRTLSSR